ncbi:hypothetical protein GCM10011575_42240 [Microlunatus endophyticus]|uniref:Hydrogenase-4 component E n=1 Tax=Microlunatus endophyticus TaxID=1716077 RepID=A0A917SHD3_9ACTN|nr:hydrogenase [Microlunatus endophyticus]GGL79423.1 hypothetical protein GCM10011575_42240 [Microlunatus endophyticus]
MQVVAPSTVNGVASTIAVLVLLVEFGMLRAGLLRSQVRLYAAQSLIASLLAVFLGVVRHEPELLILAGLSIALKTVVVPLVVLRLVRQSGTATTGSGILKPAGAALVALAVAGFGFFAVGRSGLRVDGLSPTVLGSAVAIIAVAFVLMIIRNDVVSQAVGFFSLENGVSVASLVVAAGMPLILEVAFLFDLLVAVVVFGVLMRVHHEEQSTLSTAQLTDLRG